jgi:hypothetical protein
VRTELLCEFAKRGRMHPGREGAARRDRCAARPGPKAGQQRKLGIAHVRFVNQGKAWRRAFGGHDRILGVLLRKR